jgi:hypothetical protein
MVGCEVCDSMPRGFRTRQGHVDAESLGFRWSQLRVLSENGPNPARRRKARAAGEDSAVCLRMTLRRMDRDIPPLPWGTGGEMSLGI